MENSELLFTKNYNLFYSLKDNRPVDLNRHKKMVLSMEKYGWLRSKPASVKPMDKKGQHEIIDGQHRIAKAKKEGWEICYVVEKSGITTRELNNGSEVPWSLATHIQSNADRGNKEYSAIINYSKKYGFGLRTSAMLLSGSYTCGHFADHIRDGSFTVKDKRFAENVGSLINQIAEVFKDAKEHRFVDAICAVCRLDDIDTGRLIDNIKKYPHKLIAYATRDGNLTMLQDVYNYNRRSLYSLKINAQIKMKEREIFNNNSKKNSLPCNKIIEKGCSTCLHERASSSRDNVGICNDCALSKSVTFKNWTKK